MPHDEITVNNWRKKGLQVVNEKLTKNNMKLPFQDLMLTKRYGCLKLGQKKDTFVTS